MTRRASVFGLVALALAGCGANPNPLGVVDTGTVVGTLVDAAHPTQPISTATIMVGGIVRRLSPADKGGFSIDGVPTGDSQPFHVDAPGFVIYDQTIVVHKNQTTDLHTIGLVSTAPG